MSRLEPIVGSLMLAAKMPPSATLYRTAIPAAIAGVAILRLGWGCVRPRRPLLQRPPKRDGSARFSSPEAGHSAHNEKKNR